MVFEAFKVIIDAQSLLFSFCHLEKAKLKLYGQGQVILLGLYCSYFIVFSRYYDKLWMLFSATAFLLRPQLDNHVISHVSFGWWWQMWPSLTLTWQVHLFTKQKGLTEGAIDRRMRSWVPVLTNAVKQNPSVPEALSGFQWERRKHRNWKGERL